MNQGLFIGHHPLMICLNKGSKSFYFLENIS